MKDKMFVDPFEWINEGKNDEFELDDILYDISMKIFDTRISKGMNQKEFAELLEISQSMVSKLESGEYNPTVGQMYKISKKLNLRLEINMIDNHMLEAAQKNWANTPRKNKIIAIEERFAVAC